MRVLIVSLMIVAMGTCANLAADEEKVPLDKLPKAITEAVKKRFPDAEMVSAEKETDKGKTLYEVALKNKGMRIEVTLTPEGDIQEIEKEIAIKSLPKAVAETFNTKYPKAKVKIIEEVIKVKEGKEKLEYYELHFEVGEKSLEVVIAPDGKIVKTEDQTKEKKKS